MEKQKLTAFINDSSELAINLEWAGVAFEPADEWALIFTAKDSDSDLDSAAVFQKASGAGVTVSGSVATVELVPADTELLTDGRRLFDIQAQNVLTQKVRTVAFGEVYVMRDITRLTETSVPVSTSEEALPFARTATEIHSATTKDTLDDADEFGIWESVTGLIGKATWTNIKATLKTYFDTIYQAGGVTWSTLSGKPSTFAPIIGSGAGDAVAGNDSRLTDARTPIAHTQTAITISDSTIAGRALLTAADVAAQQALLGQNEVFSASVIDLVAAHRTANSSANPRALLAWSRCLSELETGGILDELIDGACFRQGYNTATSYKSIRNVPATIRGTVPIGQAGAIFTGSTANTLSFVVSDAKVSTLAYDFRYAENTADYATPISLTASTGTATAGRSIQPNAAAASCGAVYTGNGGSAVYTSAIGDVSDAFNVHRYNALETFVSVSSDNAATPTIKVWVNGLPVLTDGAGNLQQTTDLTLLTVGAQRSGASSYTLPHTGSMASWLLFSRVLTDAENITVSKALRHLDPRTKNLVLMGDSRTAQFSNDANYTVGNWPYQYWRSPAINRSVRLVNTARNGWTAIAIRDGFAGRAAHHGVNGTSVTECEAVIWTGVNDWLVDYTDAQAWAYVQTTIGYARAQGMTVILGTDPEANGALSVGREAWRVAYNTTLRANKHMYDSLWDIDLFLKAPRTSAAWLNDYHLNHLGNGWLAGNLLQGGLQGLTTP